MKMNSRFVMAGAIALGSGAVFAHHSAAEYGGAKQQITGTVKSWEWRNPHTFLQLMVSDGKGGTVEAGFELGSPNTLIRNGFKVDTFKLGDKATVYFTPRRDGRPGGGLDAVYVYGSVNKWLNWGPGADAKAAREQEAERLKARSGTTAAAPAAK